MAEYFLNMHECLCLFLSMAKKGRGRLVLNLGLLGRDQSVGVCGSVGAAVLSDGLLLTFLQGKCS